LRSIVLNGWDATPKMCHRSVLIGSGGKTNAKNTNIRQLMKNQRKKEEGK